MKIGPMPVDKIALQTARCLRGALEVHENENENENEHENENEKENERAISSIKA